MTFFYHDDSELQRDVVKFVKERSGEGVLIIFDGFDELSLRERSEQSLFLDICRGKILPMCAVVITSRPYASRSLQELPLINRHIEVLGFTDEQVKRCIRQKIEDQVKAEDLCTELKDRLDIASICQIPLNCSIVLYVYEQENYSLPRTLTELYELFILHSLKRFIKRTPRPNVAADRLLDLKDLQSPSSGHFESLCTLAIKGLEEDKLVFSRNDVEKIFPSEYHKSERDLPVLDLMTSAKSYTTRGAQDTYNFLHLTIQEFLAAYWVAHYSPDTTKLELFQQKLMDSRFRMVLLFLSGMTKLTFLKAFDTFGQISWDRDLVHACHLLYESGNHSLYKSISSKYFSSRVIKLTGSRFDALVTSHFLAYSGCQWDKLELRSDDVKIVHKVFSTCAVDNTSIQNTTVKFCEWSGGATDLMMLKLLDDLVQTNKITVDISINEKGLDLKPSVIKILNTVLMGSNAIHKKEYTIELGSRGIRVPADKDRNFSKQFCKTLAECLTQNSSVTAVILIAVSAGDMDIFFNRLSQESSVSKLTRLKCIKGYRKCPSRGKQPPICQKFCNSLATFLSRNTSLIQVDLDIPLYSDLISPYVEIIKSGLVHNKSLQKLSICWGEIVFERNKHTNEMELLKTVNKPDLGYDNDESSDCDPSPPQAKRPCWDNQGCADLSPPGHRDSPNKLHAYGLDMAHSSQQFQPQTPKSDCLSVLSPPPPHPVTVESPPPRDIQSPGVIDLTQDSPQPYDHVDDTHFHSHSSAYPSTTTTTTPQLSSIMIKQENPFCRLNLGHGPTFFHHHNTTLPRQLRQIPHRHGKSIDSSKYYNAAASPTMGAQHQSTFPSANQLNSPPPSSGNYSHVHSHTMYPSVLVPMAINVFPPLPPANEEHQRIRSNPLAQPRVLHQDCVVCTRASHNVRQVQPVTYHHQGQSLNPSLMQHYMYYTSSAPPSMGYTQNLPELQHLPQSPHHLHVPRQRQGQSSHCSPHSHSQTPLLQHRPQNFPTLPSIKREHQSTITYPVAQSTFNFSHQDHNFYAQSSHVRQLLQEGPSMSPSPLQNYYSGTAGSPLMRHTLDHQQPFPQSPPNHQGYIPRQSESQTILTMQQTRSNQWNAETLLFSNSGQQQQQLHGPWQMSSSSSDCGRSTSYRNQPPPSAYSLGSYQHSSSAQASQSTQNQPSHSTDRTPQSPSLSESLV